MVEETDTVEEADMVEETAVAEETIEVDSRTNRAHETRETEKRVEPWAPSTLLPTPDPEDGYVFRWVRTKMRGVEDNSNVSRKLREGWVPVKLEDHPELQVIPDIDTRFDGAAVSGGLMLCKIAEEINTSQRKYLHEETENQMESVDRNFMREQDARMPLLAPERKTRVTFGDGS